jgi:hypothetical protein
MTAVHAVQAHGMSRASFLSCEQMAARGAQADECLDARVALQGFFFFFLGGLRAFSNDQMKQKRRKRLQENTLSECCSKFES